MRRNSLFKGLPDGGSCLGVLFFLKNTDITGILLLTVFKEALVKPLLP